MRMSLPQEGTHSSRGLTYSGAVAGGAMAPPIVETRRKIVNVVGNCRKIVSVVRNCQSCRRDGGGGGGVAEDFGLSDKIFCLSEKYCPCPPPPKKKQPQKTWVPRRHCLLNNTVILRSRTCTFTVGWSHCHIQNSL